MITRETLIQKLSYCPNTGIFVWRTGYRNKHIGRTAGSINYQGYVRITIDGKLHTAHRLAWLYVYGVFPAEIDHINGVKSDNRLSNLRLARRSENMANTTTRITNTSGKKGVTWHKQGNKWMAQITVNYRHIYLGLFDTVDDAHAAYCSAAEQHFGEFARRQ